MYAGIYFGDLKVVAKIAIKYIPSKFTVRAWSLHDRFNCIEMWDLLSGIWGSSKKKQVVSHGRGLSRQVSLYFNTEYQSYFIL